jgi:hypothetical protein
MDIYTRKWRSPIRYEFILHALKMNLDFGCNVIGKIS